MVPLVAPECGGAGPVNAAAGDDRPTRESIEALVRSIAAKEAGYDTGGVEPPSHPASEEPSPAPPVRRGQSVPYRAPGGPPAPGGPIPGLVDRKAWEAALVEEAERQRRYERPLAILLADLESPDPESTAMSRRMIGRMAPHCAAFLLSAARASDRVTRLGSSRFGVLLLEADEVGAERFAKRATTSIRAWLDTSPFPMRLTVGWAVARGPEELLGALRLADERLRAAD
jgi:GGDEF domain-containing protein